ncbi:hypothetical protein Fmac_025887 [Flemingia macrophylla]|uniref:LOV domain-containing protein n=1 Tax=Flemingia macrophylla TaxID=520843 RepID=A0ABD1LDB3_9FABA
MKRKGSEEKRERDLKLPRFVQNQLCGGGISSSTASRPSSSSNSRRLHGDMSGTLIGTDWWNLTEEERVPNPSLPGHPIIFANLAFLKLTGYARHEVLRCSAALFQGPLTSRSSLLQIREVVRASAPPSSSSSTTARTAPPSRSSSASPPSSAPVLPPSSTSSPSRSPSSATVPPPPSATSW